MEQETLFTASKWDILKMLANGSKSPLQLAKLSNTSVANISQQLRLLEMAGLVQSKRISNRDKGQPRQLYSLVGNHSFLISSSADFVDKKLLKLSDYNKVILKIWFLENASLHYFIEKAFWHIEDKMSEISAIYFDTKSADTNNLLLYVISENVSLKKILKDLTLKNLDGRQKNVQFSVKTVSELKKMPVNDIARLYSIYDPRLLTLADGVKKNDQ